MKIVAEKARYLASHISLHAIYAINNTYMTRYLASQEFNNQMERNPRLLMELLSM